MGTRSQEGDDLLTLKEAAKMLRMDRRTVVKLIKKRKLHASRPLRDYRIRRAAVQKLLDANVVGRVQP